jgi:RHS repeat-associated protein
MSNPFSETTSWTYQDNNWLSTQTLANGATATYTYNALGQVTQLLNQISNNTISDFSSLVYDGTGNRTSVTASIPGATSLNGTTGYTYDTKDQVTQETSTRNGGFTDNFGYDSAGNPTTFKGNTKTYNSKNQQTATGFTYDANGNPTAYNGVSLAFDPENRLTSYGSAMTAGYRGDGLRGKKQTSSATTYFLYDGTNPVLELDANGAIAATNTFSVQGVVSRRVSTVSVLYSFDSEGNVSQRTDSTGAVFSNQLFAAHGMNLSGGSSDPFGYKARSGYYSDTESGLQLLTNRYYDPATGRFLTRDPISYAGGINLYSYVANNPLKYVDPSGHNAAVEALPIVAGGVAGGGLAAGAVAVAPWVVVGVAIGATWYGFWQLGECIAAQPWNPLTHPAPPADVSRPIPRSTPTTLAPPFPPTGPKDDDDCDREWEAAREMCRQFLSQPSPPRGITGGYRDIENCARGLVSQECGGNQIDWR